MGAGHAHASTTRSPGAALTAALVAKGLLLVVQVAGAVVCGSLVLLADSAHPDRAGTEAGRGQAWERKRHPDRRRGRLRLDLQNGQEGIPRGLVVPLARRLP